MQNLKNKIDKKIAEFCCSIVQEPLYYFSEADLHQGLTEYLKQIPELNTHLPTSVNRGQGSKTKYNTPLIHREYGLGGAKRMDIVIFDPDEVNQIEHPNLTKKSQDDYLVPLFGFELGTEKSRDTATHFHKDINKLKVCKNTGYLIHIFKDTTVSISGSERRGNTENKIETSFKAILENFDPLKNPNIKVIGILICIVRLQKRMTGKCKIFTNGTDWEKVNINKKEDITALILNELK